MTRLPNAFIDPAGAGPSGGGGRYDWPINHHTMTPSGRRRTTTAVAPTGGLGLVRQQGNETPLGLTLQGTMLTYDQRLQTIAWWALCRYQTIYFFEFSGELYEVIITDFEETKIAVAYNDADQANMPFHILDYTLVMDVITPVQFPVSPLTDLSPWLNAVAGQTVTPGG